MAHTVLAGCSGLELTLKGKGELANWKVVLETKGNPAPHHQDSPTYQAVFKVDLSRSESETISLPFSEFRACSRGQLVEEGALLVPRDITTIGLQAYGGVYHIASERQAGVGALELVQIHAMCEATTS
jgi:hypothetical protein